MRKKTNKEEKKEEGLDFDFGLGKISLGGLFSGIEKLVNLASELKEAGGEIKKEGEIDLGHLFAKGESASGGKEGLKGIFGFSIKTAMGGKTVVEPFGNVKKTPQGPKVEEEREPITDVFDEKDEIKVYAEMPGVNEEAISVDLKGDILELKAVSKDRKYHKEILLPAKVKPETLEKSYKNGILEIRIKK